MKKSGGRGITLIELIVVVAIVGVLALGLYPLVRTTYNSWRAADRKVELVQIGRVGMDKMVRELRKAYDLSSVSNPLLIDFYPEWASSTSTRINYDNANYMQLEFGTATPVFINDSLAAPIDSFTYTTYDRRLNTGTTQAQQVTAFRFMFKVSDERNVLPTLTSTNLNPMTFYSHVGMRTSREGYIFARDNTYATETYRFSKSANHNICVRTFCDRVDPTIMATANATQSIQFTWVGGSTFIKPMTWMPIANPGEYFEYCPANFITLGIKDNAYVKVNVTIRDDTGEECKFQDTIRVDI